MRGYNENRIYGDAGLCYCLILEGILSDSYFSVPLLITQQDKPVGRKQILTPPHIKKWVLDSEFKLDIYQPNSLKSKEVVEKISSYKPDVIVVAAYGKILPNRGARYRTLYQSTRFVIAAIQRC